MKPSYIENNGLTEIKNNPISVKENNDRWQTKQHTLALRKIKNPEDRQAFMSYVLQTRDALENGTLPVALTQDHQAKVSVDNHLMFTNELNTAKQLRKRYKDIKKQAKQISKDMQKDNVSLVMMSNLQNTNY